MLLGVSTLGEESRGLHDDVRADGSPINLAGVLHFENLEALALDGDAVLRMRDLVRKVAENGVVLQQMRQSQRVRDVVDRHELNVPVIQRRAHDVASDAAEAVDAYFDRHFSSVGNLADCGSVSAKISPGAELKMLGVALRNVNAPSKGIRYSRVT